MKQKVITQDNFTTLFDRPCFIRECCGGCFETEDGGPDAVWQVHHRQTSVFFQETLVTSRVYYIVEDVYGIVCSLMRVWGKKCGYIG